MYKAFFGLHTKPFELVPDLRFLFSSRSHQRALSHLEYGLRERAGFILLTGEVGSGKTTLIRNLIGHLDAHACRAMVFNTRVSPEQLLALINDDFGLDTTGKDKVVLLRDLNDFLIAQHAARRLPIVMVDEAQNLSPEVLEEIRLLSNLETNQAKLLQIILIGQPELRVIINQPGLRQLRQRISITCHIDPLTREETERYVLHRLELAGNREAVRFHDGTFDFIYGFSKGLPRMINIFCDFLLLAAFVEDTAELTLELVEEVAGDFSAGTELPAGEKLPVAVDAELIADLPARIAGLEAVMRRLESAQAGQVTMLERLAMYENILKVLIAQQKEELGRLREGQRQTLRRLDEVVKIIGPPVRPATAVQSPQRQKKDFWVRLFGWLG
jgi:putative secretion ATPase (PEP-CTERM system associated)